MKSIKDKQSLINKTHYYGKYVNLQGFISYFYQIELILDLMPGRILEIGCGNKLVSNYIRQSGLNITTCDFNKHLEPDYTADIRNLPFSDSSFDLITAYEVLEHIPWEDTERAMTELKRVTKKYVIISLPYPSFFKLEIVVNNTTISKVVKRKMTSILLRIPPFFKKHKFNGYHYWEVGKKGYSVKTVCNMLSKHFYIKMKLRPTLNPYHIFFVLEKR